MTAWLIDAADLLAEPDPGPTPWLVEDVIVDRAIVAAVGRWKTTKSYGLLEICISIATGEPAFGAFAIPQPGPVVYVIEESGRAALWRRLDSLCRGRAIDPERLRGTLMLAANARVKLDDPGWQRELIDVGAEVHPRLFAFDPLARMKAPARNESAQNEMASAIEFLRQLRDDADAATLFVHHLGHQGESMRGTSDLESVWETRLAWKKDSNAVTVTSEHREAESGGPITYRLNWDHDTRTIRLELEQDETRAKVAAYLSKHPDASANKVYEALKGNRGEVLAMVKRLRSELTEPPHEGGTNAQVPPRYHPPLATPEGGTPGAPFRGPGTTTRAPGTNSSVPPPDNDPEDAGPPDPDDDPGHGPFPVQELDLNVTDPGHQDGHKDYDLADLERLAESEQAA